MQRLITDYLKSTSTTDFHLFFLYSCLFPVKDDGTVIKFELHKLTSEKSQSHWHITTNRSGVVPFDFLLELEAILNLARNRKETITHLLVSTTADHKNFCRFLYRLVSTTSTMLEYVREFP